MLTPDPDLSLHLASPAVAGSGTVLTLLTCGLLAGAARRRRHHRRIAHAMHELRRPLQALMLIPETRASRSDTTLTVLDLALAALGDLEDLLEGELCRSRISPGHIRQTWRQVLEDAADRWRQAAWLRGGHIVVGSCPDEGRAIDRARAIELARALDNLIVNALIHGGPQVVLSASHSAGQITLQVSDRGAGTSHRQQTRSGRRSGNGLEIVRGIAERLGGQFRIQHGKQGTYAQLELPIDLGMCG